MPARGQRFAFDEGGVHGIGQEGFEAVFEGTRGAGEALPVGEEALEMEQGLGGESRACGGAQETEEDLQVVGVGDFNGGAVTSDWWRGWRCCSLWL
jgi:hypothetical protein